MNETQENGQGKPNKDTPNSQENDLCKGNPITPEAREEAQRELNQNPPANQEENQNEQNNSTESDNPQQDGSKQTGEEKHESVAPDAKRKPPVSDREFSLPSDNHDRWHWITNYKPRTCWIQISIEALYLTGLLVLGFFVLYHLYMGNLYTYYCGVASIQREQAIFYKEVYCVLFGFLGGTVYAIKILYKALASGMWHQDRLLWRVFSPWVSLVLSIVIASLMADKVFGDNYFSAIIVGFFAGYFSESAIGKLYDIAHILFD